MWENRGKRIQYEPKERYRKNKAEETDQREKERKKREETC